MQAKQLNLILPVRLWRNLYYNHYLVLIFILILIFITQATHAQVVIKERVEITPQAILPNKPLGQHTIRIDMQWTPTNIAGAILNYDETGRYPCRNVGGTGFQTGGSLSYQVIDVVGGHNAFQLRFNNPCDQTSVVNVHYSVYFDETFILSDSVEVYGCYSGNAYPRYNFSYNSPLVTDYNFIFYNEDLCYNVGEDINLELGHGCTNVEIDTSSTNGDIVNLQITSGGEHASFYYQATASDNLSVPFSEVNSVRLKQDHLYTGSITNVTVEVNIGGLTKQSTMRVHPKSSYGITADYVDYPIKYDEIKYMEVRPYGPNGCSTEFPSEITLRAEIIKGSELGHLEDFDNGGVGDTLSNIPFQTFGGNHIGFVGSGVKPENIDTAIVRFSTSDAELNTVEVPVIITPGVLVVTMEPDTLQPGETASITVRQRLDNGTIIDFPEEQHFEISMIDGCTLGNIMVGSDSGNYFYDVPQPMYFKADANAEVGVVKLRIGLIEEIGIGRNVKDYDYDNENTVKALTHKEEEKRRRDLEDKIKKLNKEKRSSQPVASPENIESSCYIGEYQTYTEENTNVMIGGDCGVGAPVCSTEVQAPFGFKEEVIEVTGNYTYNKEGYLPEVLNVTAGGLTYFLSIGEFTLNPISNPSEETPLTAESFYSPYVIETCFNKNLENGKGAYQYNFKSKGTNDNYIHKPIITQVADYNDDPYAMKSINDLLNIPLNKICKVLVDFELSRYYPDIYGKNFWDVNNVLYEIVDAYWEHEKYHVRQGVSYLNEHFNTEPLLIPKPDGNFISKTLKAHLQTTFTCSEYIKNFDDAKREGEKYTRNALVEYMKFFSNEFYKKTVKIKFDGYVREYKEDELYAQWSNSVQDKITYYQSILASRQGFNPDKCKYDLTEWYKPFNKYRNNL